MVLVMLGLSLSLRKDKQNAPIIEAYGNGIQEEEKDDDSEDVRASVDVEYPDTPVESEDE